MDSILQSATSSSQLASSATSVANALATAKVATAKETTASTASTTSSTNSDTITANDFLTLLVAEMKNQDPTTPTDPTAYISQMVGVNSLQQLVSINSGISSLDTAAGVTTTASST